MTCACGLGTDHTDCAQFGNRTTPVACDVPVALPYRDDNLVGRGSADVGPLVCHQVTYPTENASWNLASRYNFTQGYFARLSFRIYNRAGNKFLSTAPYRAIIRVYANNVIGPTSAYGNNLADSASVADLRQRLRRGSGRRGRAPQHGQSAPPRGSSSPLRPPTAPPGRASARRLFPEPRGARPRCLGGQQGGGSLACAPVPAQKSPMPTAPERPGTARTLSIPSTTSRSAAATPSPCG